MPTGKAISIDDRVRALLERENTLVLASTADDGTPAATPLFYYADGETDLYWLSSPDSRHSRNMSARPRVAVAVFAQVTDWREIRGAQLEGVAQAVTDPAVRAAVLPQYRRRFALGAELDEAIERSTLYVFRPAWWRYIDSLA
jgi:nitroimidazol reductase NimA-like FMN-containing flavoprotein (pyridoxamine 5'-phosphate oxidase superfamily)